VPEPRPGLDLGQPTRPCRDHLRPGAARPISVRRRAAFNHAATGQYRPAAEEISAAIEETDDDRVNGWLKEQLATYTQLINPAQAQQILAGELKLNPRVMRLMTGVSYSRLSPVVDQARAAAEYLAAHYADRNSLIVGVEAVLENLVLDPDHTSEFEDTMEQIAFHLGFTAQRPERDTGNGPDVLWSVGSLSYLVIERKSGATADQIWRSAAEQLAHSMNWFGEHYDTTCRATPLLVHKVNMLANNASARPAPGSSPRASSRTWAAPSAARPPPWVTPETGATPMPWPPSSATTS
jgi:hypothetical protein